ncbi:thiamine pyrophosphate-binding protein [Leucobacter sp. CSA2]|uniref:Thiamine pyrophosphate-binding protein n=1 Tax=Leucobacter edaphi TaxID=2796472 RepID=A0A934QE14_9MICO|nr:thiamine pyrophosphate-binding protein [Leucobacter edaphi]MBK0421539.1 thiamine pyrophosphate-binding protein [Leucobacter edaphi]
MTTPSTPTAPAEDRGARIGGDVVLESLIALGARAVVGLPGQHALGLFDALRRSDIAYLSARVENNAGFMADGLARVTGGVAPLLLSTGPGALTSLAALQEAAASSIPVLAISAQIPVAGLGGGRHGYLHELPQQSDSFRGVVKHVVTVRTLSQIPTAIAEAWRIADTAPRGPVLVEVPQDILLADASAEVPALAAGDLDPAPAPLLPIPASIGLAAEVLANAERPVIYAGGGVTRAGAADELRALAERLDAPVVTTFSGKNAMPWSHELSARSWVEDIATTEFLEDADVLLIVGSGVGELSSNYHTFRPAGRVIQIEADLGKIGSNHAGIGIHADAKPALAALDAAVAGLGRESDPERRAASLARIGALLDTVLARVEGQGFDAELALLRGLREAVPAATPVFWDMTILAYWGWSFWDPREAESPSAQGAGGLGYGLPAALGAAFGRRERGENGSVLAVSGDGGALYGIAELAVAAQHDLPVVWLIVDDGGYGVLREYMEGAFGAATATELTRPNYVALAESFGIPAELTSMEEAPAAVARALAAGGPRVVVLPAVLGLFAPTHLDRLAGGAATEVPA